MRNPITSILAQALKLEELIENLDLIINTSQTPKQLKKSLKKLKSGYKECQLVLTSSAKLLKYNVNDMLSFAQINGGKFRKEILSFDIRKAVEEVMMIQ